MSGAVIVCSANIIYPVPGTTLVLGDKNDQNPRGHWVTMPTSHGTRPPGLTALSAMDCFLGPHHQPVLPNPPPVVLLSPAAHRRLLLYAAGASLDQVSSLGLAPEVGVSDAPSPPARWAYSRALTGDARCIWGTVRAHLWLPAGQAKTESWWPRSTYSWSSWCWFCPPWA